MQVIQQEHQDIAEKAQLGVTPQEFKGLLSKKPGSWLINAYILVLFLYHFAYTLGIFTTRLLYVGSLFFNVGSVFLVIGLVFIFAPASKGAARARVPWYDIALAMGGAAGCGYVLYNIEAVSNLEEITYAGVIFGTIMVLVVLESVRRTAGMAVVIFVVVFFLYAMFSNYFPGILWSLGFTFEEMIAACFLYENGMLGFVADIWAKIVVLFILFAGIIQVSGAGKFIMNLALGLFGRFMGGAAKVSVVASGLFGSIAPAGPANIAFTGSITIPIMKATGHTPEFAGAVEAVASSLGTLTPPIMGVLSFVIARWLQLPYYLVVLAALLPATLFYVCLLFMVDFHARSRKLPSLSHSQLPSVKLTLKQGWHYILPIAVFVYFLLIAHYSPQTSILYTVIALLIVGQFRKDCRLTPSRLMVGMQRAARVLVVTAPVFIAVGIVMASVNITGMPIRFSALVTELCRDSLPLLLLMTALASFIMGTGLHGLVCYFILAALAAPALVKAGILPIAAHLFVVYTAIVHAFTPPVMAAVIIASGMAKSNIWRTSLWSMGLAISMYIVPFVFIYNPCLLLQGGCGVLETVTAVVSSLVGVICLAAAVQGWMLVRLDWPQRILFLASGIIIILNLNAILNLSGFCLLALAFLRQGITPMGLVRKALLMIRKV